MFEGPTWTQPQVFDSSASTIVWSGSAIASTTPLNPCELSRRDLGARPEPVGFISVLGLPACVVGKTFNFEPVPTDVELGRDGLLSVSSLPGGPEDESLGGPGCRVLGEPLHRRGHEGRRRLPRRYEPGDSTRWHHLRRHVAELFGGRISRVSDGGAVPVVDVPSPAGLEWGERQALRDR
jgi:hypothetical protein